MLSRIALRSFRPIVRFSSDFPKEEQPLIVERLQGDDEGTNIIFAGNKKFRHCRVGFEQAKV